MQSSSARAAHLWVALNSPWGIVTVWLLIVLALQARLASQLLAAASGPMVVWVVIALSALSTATVLLCGARAGYGPWQRRLSLASIVAYLAGEAAVRWSPWAP